MNMSPKISLDQWRALVGVVESGSYAAAAEALHKSQSTVSYAVQRIEALLQVDVFRVEGRRAVLTPEGEVLYRRGRHLVAEAERLEFTASRLSRGVEAQLNLGVEIVFPTWLLLQCLDEFAVDFPETRIELFETVLGGGEELLKNGQVDLAICSRVPPGFVGDPFMRVRLVAMAAPEHPLHHLGRPLTHEDLRGHRHLIIRDSGTRRESPGAHELTEERWTVSNKATSIRAACMGLGFAWFAEEMVREELHSGALRPLPLTVGQERWAMLYRVNTDPDSIGPGAQRLNALLTKATARCPGSLTQPQER